MVRLIAIVLAILVLAGFLGLTHSVGAEHVSGADIIRVLAKDAIPAILRPTFDTDEPGWLPDSWRVIGLSIGGNARAYPIAILNWHELVNDLVGDRPVAVTFCPLCGTAIVYDRDVGSEVLSFGVSGKLYKNDLVMYDHQTESYWTQLLGEAITGTYHGTRLELISSTTVSWGEWRAMHPDSSLLDRPRDNGTGYFLRDYTRNPYAGYESSTVVYFEQGNVDPFQILHPKDLVLGVVSGGEARAYPSTVLREQLVVNDVLGGVPLVVTYADGAMKAWERGDRNFTPAGERSLKDGLGRTYDRLTGAGADGSLVEIPAVTSFWFAWYDFFPATSIYGLEILLSRRPAEGPVFASALGLAAVGSTAAAVVSGVAYAWHRRGVRAARAMAKPGERRRTGKADRRK